MSPIGAVGWFVIEAFPGHIHLRFDLPYTSVWHHSEFMFSRDLVDIFHISIRTESTRVLSKEQVSENRLSVGYAITQCAIAFLTNLSPMSTTH